MARLPQPGSDAGQWGDILNDYLSQAHEANGTLKSDTVDALQLKSNAVTNASIADSSITTAKLSDGAVTASKLADDAVTAAKIADLGAANGVASLDSNAQLVGAQLPDGYMKDFSGRLLDSFNVADYADIAPLRAVRDLLDMGLSCPILLMGDSTGNAIDEWFALLGGSLGAAYSTHTVHHRQWNDATQMHDRPAVIQTGSAGRLKASMAGGSLFYWQGAGSNWPAYGSAPTITSDLDVRINLKPTTWNVASQQALVVQWGNSGDRAFRLWLYPGKLLRFDWSTDGANAGTGYASSALPFTDGDEAWVRVVLDVDNGSGGHTVTFYSSTDGTTWTSRGSSSPTGATSIFQASNRQIDIGNRTGTTEVLAGEIYEVELRDGIAGQGQIVMPTFPDAWSPHPNFTGSVSGSPVLTLWNSSQPGQNIAYLGNVLRFPRMTPRVQPAAVLISDSHNENTAVAGVWLGLLSTFVQQIRTRYPYAPIVAVTQNPRFSPADVIKQHAQRIAELRRSAPALGIGIIDSFRAFEQDPRGLTTLISSDGIHPIPAGEELWRDVALSAVGLRHM